MFPLLQRRRAAAEDEAEDGDHERKSRKLNGKRLHLRNQLSANQRETAKLWTAYRNTDDRKEKKELKRKIRKLQSARKDIVKQMAKVQREMTKLGFQTEAGHVDLG